MKGSEPEVSGDRTSNRRNTKQVKFPFLRSNLAKSIVIFETGL